MSFGFGVGDFIAGAQLAYTLCKALSDSRGSAQEYQELISQLDVVHKVLLQVDQLRAANQLGQATVNALLFAVNSTNEVMETFLDKIEAYQKSLKPGGSGHVFKDLFRKGAWGFHMPEKVKDLKASLTTMLAAINCLVSIACYQKTSYGQRYTFETSPHIRSAGPLWKGIEVKARFNMSFTLKRCPEFRNQADPTSFFRPGQIFAAQITSTLQTLHVPNDYTFRNVDLGHLPLEETSKLKDKAPMEDLEHRTKRLAQIRRLPLYKMVPYCKDIPQDRGKVECLLCIGRQFNKDQWTSDHFRLVHWTYYFSMVSEIESRHFSQNKRVLFVPRQELAKPAPDSEFSLHKWIIIDDVTKTEPIETDCSIMVRLDEHADISVQTHYLAGPIMIKRFIVVRQGINECLCLGIHTYARTGCSSQPDQELFAIIYSGKEVPLPLLDETKMVLHPIRMKLQHPSTALPRSARVHFGRAYEISHSLEVQPLGLVHSTSMETLLDQFEAKVFKANEEPKRSSSDMLADDQKREVSENSSPDSNIEPADMDIAKEIRQNIIKVLGDNLSPTHKQLR